MKEYRPRLRVERTTLMRVADAVAYGGLLCAVVMVLSGYPELPDTMATHFGFDGRADAWGPKSSILFLPVVQLALVTLLSVLGRYPHVFNYVVGITAENAAKQYGIAVGMLTVTKALVSIIFAYIAYASMESAMLSRGMINPFVLFGLVGLVFANLWWFIGKSMKCR